ncbi:MAG: hypothetical protein RLZZ175_3052 [Bacteroidota bacterium]|jgi:hypothetical protein
MNNEQSSTNNEDEEKYPTYDDFLHVTNLFLKDTNIRLEEILVNLAMVGELSEWNKSVREFKGEVFPIDGVDLLESCKDPNIVLLRQILENMSEIHLQFTKNNPQLENFFEE